MTAFVLALALAMAPQVPSLVQASLAAQPTDVAVTPDGDFAFVRSTRPTPVLGGSTSNIADHLSVWDLQTRTRVTMVPLGGGTLPPAGFGDYDSNRQASDLVEVNNTNALCGGSDEATATTFIDVVQFPDPTNANATLIATLAFDVANNLTVGPAGRVNDVAITPNGKIGVVNYLNSVTFIRMRTGAVLGTQNLMTLGMPAGQSSTVSPEGATDSIALTDDVAAVISTRDPGTNNSMPWIFLFNLKTNPPSSTYASPFVNINDAPGGPGDFHSIARSVRIPKDLRQVVMSADFIVASRSLGGGVFGSFPSSFINMDETRRYEVIRDSLEVTDSRAIALSNNTLASLPNPNGLPHGRVTIFSIAAAGAISIIGQPHELNVVTISNRTHDLAISPDNTIAVVKTEEMNVLITDLEGLNGGPTLPPPLASQANPLPPVPNAAFVSDSVVISADGTTAITIGARFNASTLFWEGVAEFIPLSGAQQLTSVNFQQGHIFAADLKLTRENDKVLVRYKTTPGAASVGQDFVLYNFTSGIDAQFAADGDTFWLDDIEMGSGTAIGIGETKFATPIPASGHVHLFWFW